MKIEYAGETMPEVPTWRIEVEFMEGDMDSFETCVYETLSAEDFLKQYEALKAYELRGDKSLIEVLEDTDLEVSIPMNAGGVEMEVYSFKMVKLSKEHGRQTIRVHG